MSFSSTPAKDMYCSQGILDPRDVKIVKGNTNNSIANGSVYATNYPSYTRVSPWECLRDQDFPLLGVQIIGGHKDINPNTLIKIVKTLNSVRNYDLTIDIILPFDDDDRDRTADELKTFNIFLTPEETDMFIFDAFIHGLQMAGWTCGAETDNDGMPTYWFQVQNDFYATTP